MVINRKVLRGLASPRGRLVNIYYGMSEVISFRVRRELKEKMERLRHINWSEVVRRAMETIKREESRLKERDRARMKAATLRTDRLCRRIPGWDGVEEIRR